MNVSKNSVKDVTVFGAVLAGGRSSRMGTDKRFLKIEEEYLVDRALRVVTRAIGEDRTRVYLCGEVPGRPSILDAIPHLGPLSGILSAVRQVCAQTREQTALLLVVPIDMPLLTVEVLQQLLKNVCLIDGEQLNSIAYENFELPLLMHCNSFTLKTLNEICQSPSASFRSIRTFQEAIGVHRIFLESASDESMMNANTPHDWNRISTGVKA